MEIKLVEGDNNNKTSSFFKEIWVVMETKLVEEALFLFLETNVTPKLKRWFGIDKRPSSSIINQK